ncbi:MAG: DUF3078 domain-containing protein [Bacteroidota bacterium]
MKGILTVFVFYLMCTFAFGQTKTMEELKAEQAEKAAELAELEVSLGELQGKVDGLKADVAKLTDAITPYPRWSTGLLGNIGLNLSGFNDWFLNANPSTRATTIGFTSAAFANLQQEKYFWRNGGNLALSWLKFDDNPDVDTGDEEFQIAADALNITSLFGYKLNPKLAASGLGEYRTAILDGALNNPGYLDLGVGATWTPIENLVVVFHPLNYNFVFADEGFDYQSSLGLKAVIDYTTNITEGIAWRSNLSTFVSYEDASELSNWTWVNNFSTAYKGIGIGLDLGLRQNKQEANAQKMMNPNADISDNPLQTYYVLGLSYNLSSN